MRKRLIIAALAAMALVVAAGSALAANGKSVIFDSTNPNGPKTNLPSYGPTAYSFATIGDKINLGGTARSLNNVTVTLSSWACQQGSWNGKDCVTQPGATFSQPITLTITDAAGRPLDRHVDEELRRSLPPVGEPQVHRRRRRQVDELEGGVQERPRERRHLQLLGRDASRHGCLRDLVPHGRSRRLAERRGHRRRRALVRRPTRTSGSTEPTNAWLRRLHARRAVQGRQRELN